MAANGRHRDVDDVLAAALASGRSYREAGAAAGISERTVRRRMADPGFRGKVVGLRGAEIERTRGLILREAPAAVAALSDLAAGAESESVRLGAAKAVLGLALPRVGDFALDSISRAEFREWISEVVELSMERIPADDHEAFILAVRGLATRAR
jgi:hypothetical protein